MANSKQTDFDVIVIGAGISGINAGYRLQTQCPDRSYTILENRADMGGTWDLFKYPGIRSDSDLHTFGFPWRPWHEEEAIASGDLIKKYIRESAEMYGIDQKIRYHHKLVSANWSSDQQKWTLSVEVHAPGSKVQNKTFSASFLVLGTGYYDYENALEAPIPGIESFKGTVIHPQWWPEGLDYSNKKMVIIGSGATAVTLLPVLAQTAESVTMLQRSPGYLMSLPTVDPTGSIARKIMPDWLAHRFVRWKFLILPFLFFHYCRAFPNSARRIMRKITSQQLPKNYPMDPNFAPKYNPWEQRLCVCPDGDFYKAIREEKADIATGHIKQVTEHSIELESGQTLDADIIITATGLKIQMAGGAKLSVDNEEYHVGDHFVWKGIMLEDLPNAALVIGYTNASWTLGADATAQHICRLLNSMKKNGQTSVIPRVDADANLEESSVLNLNSTYIQRAKGKLPKAGDRGPWRSRANYFTDLWEAKFGGISDGLQFFRVST